MFLPQRFLLFRSLRPLCSKTNPQEKLSRKSLICFLFVCFFFIRGKMSLPPSVMCILLYLSSLIHNGKCKNRTLVLASAFSCQFRSDLRAFPRQIDRFSRAGQSRCVMLNDNGLGSYGACSTPSVSYSSKAINLVQSFQALFMSQNWPAGPVVLNVKWAFSTRFFHKSTTEVYNIYALTNFTRKI